VRGAEDNQAGPDRPNGRVVRGSSGDGVDDLVASAALDVDQTASDSDKAASNSDQRASRSDQSAGDRNQRASDEDQAATDRALHDGPGRAIRATESARRIQTTQSRNGASPTSFQTGEFRDITGGLRDVNANERTDVASARDRAPELRDRRAQAQDHVGESRGGVGRDEQTRATRDRQRAADDRTRAAGDRLRAAQERADSARDRKQASSERVQAAKDLEASETDELTHVQRRGAGLAQLRREIDRARRAPEELVVTFIDVDGLKSVNDTKGHFAGDCLLIAVANSLRARLRSYDLIMRFGGDEFVCAMPKINVQDVRRRFADVSEALAKGPTGGSITVGFAALSESDSAEDLIHRADEDLLAHRASP
jgi:diguanylate cyclase (GGDEF)-like protein